eukprot:gene43712-10714_t
MGECGGVSPIIPDDFVEELDSLHFTCPDDRDVVARLHAHLFHTKAAQTRDLRLNRLQPGELPSLCRAIVHYERRRCAARSCTTSAVAVPRDRALRAPSLCRAIVHYERRRCAVRSCTTSASPPSTRAPHACVARVADMSWSSGLLPDVDAATLLTDAIGTLKELRRLDL